MITSYRFVRTSFGISSVAGQNAKFERPIKTSEAQILPNFGLEELQERLHSCFGLFFDDPMAGVFQDDQRYIGRDQLHLARQHISICLFAPDCEDWHGEPGLGELR